MSKEIVDKKDFIKWGREGGKKGASKRWSKRYDLLEELSKFTTNEQQRKYIKWPTKYLEELLWWVRKVN